MKEATQPHPNQERAAAILTMADTIFAIYADYCERFGRPILDQRIIAESDTHVVVAWQEGNGHRIERIPKKQE